MLPAIFLIILAVGYRLGMALSGNTGDWVPNFSPLASIALCGAVFFPRKWAVAIPLTIMLSSDWFLNRYVFGVPFWTMEILPRYLALALVSVMGLKIRSLAGYRLGFLAAATITGSLLFYVITNSASWIGNPAYLQNWHGLLQALTVGEPGFLPTWTFFRNSLVSDLLFSAAFYVSIYLSERPRNALPNTQALALRH